MDRWQTQEGLRAAWQQQAARPFPTRSDGPDPSVAEIDSKIAGALQTCLFSSDSSGSSTGALQALRRLSEEASTLSVTDQERDYLSGWLEIIDAIVD
jgi:hypothetical protein